LLFTSGGLYFLHTFSRSPLLDFAQKVPAPARSGSKACAWGKTRVSVPIQVVSSHPVLTSTVERLLSHLKDPSVCVLPPAANEPEAASSPVAPRIFILDGCSLRTNLGALAARLRGYAPASKFLALLPPGDGTYSDEIRLFYWGIDGFVELHKTWLTELPRAIRSMLKGQLWVPSQVLLAFVKNAKVVLDAQLLPGHSLTKREAQVLQLLMRRLKNKEIASALSISERTAKFHVSNILGKLQVADRDGLSPEKLAVRALASSA
jgi:DNA-binding NarL/FixJ family response regulator